MGHQKVTQKAAAGRNMRSSGQSQGRPSGKLVAGAFGLFALLGLTVFGSTAYLAANGIDPVEFYSNMANPYMRFVKIDAGQRREQTAEAFAKVLSWSDADVKNFLDAAPKDVRGSLDGYYLPGTYWVRLGASGGEVARQMLDAFNAKVSDQVLGVGDMQKLKGQIGSNGKINLDTAVRIASIIQREAAGRKDMNLISGVIWNRLFKGMTLDMDATLQYAKGNSDNWWPQVKSKDKNIKSAFNTYKNKGLPPTAIANPSIDAIKAALNPVKTDCLFYLHDNNRGIHCTATYAAHQVNIQRYLVGQK